MIRGEEVSVIGFVVTGQDDLGNDVREELDPVPVGNVLVAPGAQADATEDSRPDGVVVAYTLYFPKTYVSSLDGCDVLVRGHRCHVVGHPDRYRPCPTQWNMKCEVSYVEG